MPTRHHLLARSTRSHPIAVGAFLAAVSALGGCGASSAQTTAVDDVTAVRPDAGCAAFLAQEGPLPAAGPLDLRAAYRQGETAPVVAHYHQAYDAALADAAQTFVPGASAEALRGFFFRWVYVDAAILKVGVDRFVVPAPLAIGLACLEPSADWLVRGGFDGVSPDAQALRWLRGE